MAEKRFITLAREVAEMCKGKPDIERIATYLEANSKGCELDGMVKLSEHLYSQIAMPHEAVSFARLCEILDNGGRYRFTAAGLPSVMNALESHDGTLCQRVNEATGG
jgi:uncharacterized protein YozE (UPF0346 family)